MPRNEEVIHYASYHGREALSYIIRVDGVAKRLRDLTDAADYAVTYASFESDSSNGTPIIAETATGVSIEPSQTITYDSVVGKIRLDFHGLENGMEVYYTASGSGFGSLLTARRYFVRDANEHYFNLAYYTDGPAITLGAASGTHTIKIVGQVIYTPSSNSCYPAIGTQYACFFVVNTGSETFPRSRFPESEHQNDGGMIEVLVK